MFNVKSVERALKELWNDDDLHRHDRQKYHSFVAHEDDGEEAKAADAQMPDLSGDPDPKTAYWADQAAVGPACAAIAEPKRTFKEARRRRTKVKMGSSIHLR